MGRRWRRPIHGRLVVVWCRSSPPWCRWFCSPQSVVKRKKQESVMFYGFWILDHIGPTVFMSLSGSYYGPHVEFPRILSPSIFNIFNF
jgi:hypothetical protein